MLGSISEELVKIQACKSQSQSLRDQMEADYSTIRLDKFEIPKAEGKWDNYTTNKPSTLVGSYVRTLAGALLKLWIEPSSKEEGKKQSRSRTMTEQLARGAIWTANHIQQAIPEGRSLQENLASDACERGGTVLRCFLREEEVHGERKLVPDIVCWDPLNTYWISGENGLLWVCYMRYGNKFQLEKEYQGTLTASPDNYGRVCIFNVWDGDEMGSFCENGGGEWIKKQRHGLDYIPVHIIPVGARPLRQGKTEDTLKDSWQSAIAHNRLLYPIKSRLQSYILTQAGIVAKPAIITEFDSSKGGQASSIDGDPITKGAQIPLDAGRGENLRTFVDAVPIADVFAMLIRVDQEISEGGIAPIALGFTAEAQTASGIAQLTEAARQSISPFSLNMEEQYRWLGEEIARQFKHGDFEETELEGYEANGKKFKVLVNPSEINDNEHFQAELNLNLRRDKLADMALIEKGIQLGIMSRRAGQELFNDDPDLAQEQIDREKVREVVGEPFWNVLEPMLEEAKESGKFGSLFMNALLQKVREMSGVQPRIAIPERTQIVPGIPPVGTRIGQIANEPVTEEARAARIGLEIARR